MLKKVWYYGTPKHNNENCILWIVWVFLMARHKYRQCFGWRAKAVLPYLLCQATEDPPRKRHCITHLTSISTRKAMFVWVLWVLTLKIRLRLRNLYRRGNIIFSILISVIHYVKT